MVDDVGLKSRSKETSQILFQRQNGSYMDQEVVSECEERLKF